MWLWAEDLTATNILCTPLLEYPWSHCIAQVLNVAWVREKQRKKGYGHCHENWSNSIKIGLSCVMADHHTLEAMTMSSPMVVPLFDTSSDSLDFSAAPTCEPSPRYCFGVPPKSVLNGGLLNIFEYKKILKNSEIHAQPNQEKRGKYVSTAWVFYEKT